MKILIAEDDEISRILLESILVDGGHEVTVTEDGVKALEEFKRGGFSMVITDWMMPGMDGVELAEEIRELYKDREEYPYIIMVTAKNHEKDMIYALESGVDDFLSKPYDREVLRQRIRAGETEVDLLHSPELSHNDPLTSLRDDHKFLAAMGNILEVIGRELENGVPEEIIKWWDSTALKMTFKVHIEKEDRYMALFLERLLEAQGEWLMDLSSSSFDKINEEHERMIFLLNEVHTAIHSYIESERAIFVLMEKAKTACSNVMNEEDFSSTLMNYSIKYLEYRSLKEESISMLRNSIELYINLLREHESMEEHVFFPFAEKYWKEEDIQVLEEEFRSVEEEAGINEIKAHLLEVSKLSETISAGAKTAREGCSENC